MSAFLPTHPAMWLLALVVVVWFAPTLMMKVKHEPVLGFFWLNLIVGWLPPVWVGLAVYSALA